MSSILKVSSIQDPTNSNTALSIDTSGRVTTPARPAFRVKFDANTSAINIVNNTEVDWNTHGSVDFDIGSHFDLANNKYVVPVTGLYQVNAQVAIQSAEASTGVYLYFNINGTNTYMGSLDDPQGGGYATSTYSSLLSFSANDELSIQIRTITDTSVVIRAFTTEFSGFLVG